MKGVVHVVKEGKSNKKRKKTLRGKGTGKERREGGVPSCNWEPSETPLFGEPGPKQGKGNLGKDKKKKKEWGS